MRTHKWMKVFSAMAASAAMLAACGGGGSDPLPPAPPPVAAAPPAPTGTTFTTTYTVSPDTFGQYFDSLYGGQTLTSKGVGTNPTVFSADTGTKGIQLYVGDGSIKDLGFGASVSGKFLRITKLSSNAEEVRIVVNYKNLNGVAGNNYSYNSCTPIFLVGGVSTTPKDFVIDLTKPATTQERSDRSMSCNGTIPATADALKYVDSLVLQIFKDGPSTLGLSTIDTSVGGGTTVTTPPTTPTVTVTVGPNAVVSFADGNAATSVQGAVIQQSKYSGDQTLPTTTLAITSFTSAGGRLSIVGNGGAGGYSGVGANLQLAPANATVTWAAGGTISFSIASINASDMKVMLNGGSLGDGGACYPTHDLSADGLSTTAKTLTLALDIATFPVPSGCANLTQTQAVLLADALGSLRQIQVEDNNKSAPVNFSIGEISRIAGTTNSAVFTTLRDASATSYAVSAPNYNSTQIVNGTYGSIVDNSGVITFNGAVGDRNLQVFLGGSSANIASSSTTMRIVGMTTNAKRVAFALVAAAGSGAPSCQVMYEVIVAAGTTQYDIDLSTPSTNTYGQTLCTTQADITAVRGAVGDVVIRAFGNADQGSFEITSDVSFTIDKIEAN